MDRFSRREMSSSQPYSEAPTLWLCCAPGKWVLLLGILSWLLIVEGHGEAGMTSFTAEEYAFAGTGQMEAGWQTVRLINRGRDVHQVQFLRLPPDKTVEDVNQALARRPGYLPQWLKRFGGVNSVASGNEASVVIYLDPGEYVLLCGIPDATGRPHAAHGMVRPLHVSELGSRVSAPPQSDRTVRLRDFSFSWEELVQVGDHIVQVSNEGTQAHELIVIRLVEGASTQDFLTSYRPGSAQNPAGAEIGGMTGIDPGRKTYVHIDMQPGRYGLICFLADPVTRTPHFAYGMWMDLKVQLRPGLPEGP